MGARLRILSANVANGGADPGALAELVRESAPDVLALQELTPGLADTVARLLPHGRLEPATDHCGMGVALAAPAAYERLALEHRDARVVELDPTHWPHLPHPVEVVNVHIASPGAKPYRAQPRRRRLQLRALCAYLDATAGRPRAVVGDLNATPLWPVYRRVAARLEDVPLRLAREAGLRPERTWRWRAGDGPRLLRLDHCFAGGLRGERVEVLELRGSDHCALLVDFALGD
jgi:endonuclease/exonuclease/phosphatase (EEP) superfamily protein YafD